MIHSSIVSCIVLVSFSMRKSRFLRRLGCSFSFVAKLFLQLHVDICIIAK